MLEVIEQGRVPWTEQELEAALRTQHQRYHHLHPFHRRMNAGELTPTEVRRWVANRFYYQTSIPLKDAAILSNCPHVEVRRQWIQRIIDHDGSKAGEGGIEAWLRLGEAVGLSQEELLNQEYLLPGVRFAVDAYVNFCRTRPWIEAIAASLTELFGPDAIRIRLAALEEHYSWIDPTGFDYFRVRLQQAPQDARYALNLVLHHCRTWETQERAVQALAFKCDLLWSQLEAIEQGDTRPIAQNKGDMIEDHSRPRFVRGVRLRWDEARKRYMLLFPEGALALNSTAGAVLELCDGQRTIDVIVTELEERYPGATVRNDVYQLLGRIAERGLLVFDNA